MTILFAVDLTEPKSVIETVEQMCERLDAQLMVLHVDAPVEQVTSTTVEPLSGAGMADPYTTFNPATQEEIKSAREHGFFSFIYSNFSIPIRPALREGDPAAIIIEDAHEHEVDLIVLGKRHHPMLETLLVGSVSRNVIEKTDIPTLLVPLPAHEDVESDGDED